MSWPPYAIPLARMPILRASSGEVTQPSIVRLVQGQGLEDALKSIHVTRYGNAVHFMRQGAIAFAYCPGVGALPTSVLFFAPTFDEQDPFHLNKVATDNMDPVERNSWMWFLFDVLGVEAYGMSNKVQATLLVPDFISDENWDRMTVSSESQQLKVVQKELTNESERRARMEDALTHGPRSEAWDTYTHFYGPGPSPVELDTLSTQLIELRAKGVEIGDKILEAWAQGKRKREDFSTIYPLVKTQITAPFTEWSVIGVGLVDHFRWTVHRDGTHVTIYLEANLSNLLTSPSSGSTEGPMQALAQANLFLPERDFDTWLDATMCQGELLYDDEAYQMLGVDPAFYDEDAFKMWANGMELGQ